MSKLNMKEWINEIIQKKEVVAMPIMCRGGLCDRLYSKEHDACKGLKTKS